MAQNTSTSTAGPTVALIDLKAKNLVSRKLQTVPAVKEQPPRQIVHPRSLQKEEEEEIHQEGGDAGDHVPKELGHRIGGGFQEQGVEPAPAEQFPKRDGVLYGVAF
mgnify:CR=1 FL=1